MTISNDHCAIPAFFVSGKWNKLSTSNSIYFDKWVLINFKIKMWSETERGAMPICIFQEKFVINLIVYGFIPLDEWIWKMNLLVVFMHTMVGSCLLCTKIKLALDLILRNSKIMETTRIFQKSKYFYINCIMPHANNLKPYSFFSSLDWQWIKTNIEKKALKIGFRLRNLFGFFFVHLIPQRGCLQAAYFKYSICFVFYVIHR